MTLVKALGRHYFAPSSFPVTVKNVPAGSGPQHAYDLTETAHYHDFSELVIATGGSAVQHVNNVEYPVAAGDVFLIQGFSEHYFSEREEFSHLNVMFDAGRLPLALDWLRRIPGYNVIFELEPNCRDRRNFKHRLHLKPASLAHAETIVQAMLDEAERRRAGYEAALFGMLLELIVYISRQYSPESPDKHAALVRIAHVISMLESEYTRPWRLAQMAKLAGMSVSNLLLLFKAATGVSPVDYLVRIRLRRAAVDLREGGESVSAIALKHGFNDSNYFSKKFKQIYAVSPRAYRCRFQV